MADITLKDFRGGLDTRKYVLSQPAGVLAIANNAHINQGAELEKRKAFTKLANSSGAVSTSLPTGTFGWQATASGHLVFGSADGSALTFPSGVTYQRLRHPQALASYGDVSMTQLVFSEIYGGKAFAIAKFGTSGTFCYYDGTLISDFAAGIILAYMNSDAKVAEKLAALINASNDYTATQQAGTGKIDVFGPPGALYTTSITENSTGGTLVSQLLNNGLATVAGAQAVGQFQIVAGSVGANNYISSVKVNNAEMLKNGTAINYTTDAATTAALVAISISSNAGTSGFYAVANANIVSIIAIAVGTSANSYEVKVTANGTVCIGNCVLVIGGDSTVGMTSILSSATLVKTTQRAHAAFVATLTIGTHSFTAGQTVTISGVGDSRYNGSFVISSVVANVSISYSTATSFAEAAVADTNGTVVYTTGSNIMGGAVSGTSNGLNALAENIAAAIRTNSGTTGFLACAVASSIYISKVTTSSSDPALSLVATTAGAGLTVGGQTGTTTIALSVYTLATSVTATGTGKNIPSAALGSVSVITGGTTNPPFTYLWTLVTDDATYPGKFTISNKYNPTVSFNFTGMSLQFAPLTGTVVKSIWKCTITDALGNVFTTANIELSVTMITPRTR